MYAGTPDLPDQARAVLGCWREACAAAGGVPDIVDFAPFRIPAALLPWVTTLRRTGPTSLEYRIVGEELTFLYGSTPRGRQVLDYAPESFRNSRYSVIFRSLDTDRAFWFRGDILFAKFRVQFGRLGLPMRSAEGQVLLLLYFPIGDLPRQRTDYLRSEDLSPDDVVWMD